MYNSDTIILVGGLGTRLQPVVSDRPKPMAQVMGKPFLEWTLRFLVKQGIQRVVLATGYRGDMVWDYFGDGESIGLDIVYSQEDTPLGTGGAVRKAMDLVTTKDVLVLNGDSLCNFNHVRLRTAHINNQADATIWLVEMDECQRYGIVETSIGGRVVAFKEKSSDFGDGVINAGVYLFSSTFLFGLPYGEYLSMETQIFPQLIARSLFSVTGPGPFLDIGTPESYSSSEKFINKLFFDHENLGVCQ
jgi:NDP-sugar pyrophosphorylase family protein